MREKRKDLNQIELSGVGGQYSPLEVDSELAQDCIDTVEKLPLIKKIWKDRWCGD